MNIQNFMTLSNVISDLDRGFEIIPILKYIITPLLITVVLASLIGIERQNIGKAAGLSSHLLVAISSCGIAVMQLYMFRFSGVEQGDPNGQQRVIAQVITGVGFIGAGVIIKNKMTIKGLTTAATIWSVAMIGLIIGSGYLIIGVVLGLIIVLFLYGRDVVRGVNPFKPIDSQSFRRPDDRRYHRSKIELTEDDEETDE